MRAFAPGQKQSTRSSGGTLIIGDNTGCPAAVILEGNSQLGTFPITVNTNSCLDLNGFNQEIGALYLNAGSVSSGTDPVGILTLRGDVTVSDLGPAGIQGRISIPSTRYFDVSNSTSRPDLFLQAIVSGPGKIVKTGPGSIGLYQPNTFTGELNVQQGVVYAFNDLGFRQYCRLHCRQPTGVLAVANNVQIAGEPLTLNGWVTASRGIGGKLWV